MNSGGVQVAAARSALVSPVLSSSTDVTTPHTVVADLPATYYRGGVPAEKSSVTLTSLSPLTPPNRHTTRSDDDLQLSTAFSLPAGLLSPSQRYLLDVIQQQQERIAALQSSLLHATQLMRRTSHPFSFDAASESACDSPPLPEGAAPFLPLSSPFVSPIKGGISADVSLTEASAATRRSFSFDGEVDGDLIPASSSTAPMSTDVVDTLPGPTAVPHDLRLNAGGATVGVQGTPPERSAVASAVDVAAEAANSGGDGGVDACHEQSVQRATPLRSSPTNTTTSPANSVPRTDGLLDAAATRDDDVSFCGEGVYVSVHAMVDDETVEGSDDSSDDRLRNPTPKSTCAESTNDELARLARTVQTLSDAHRRLRVRCAREACDRRDVDDRLCAMIGCVRSALDDADRPTAPPTPLFNVNVLKYMLRQCARILASASADEAAPPTSSAPPLSSPQGHHTQSSSATRDAERTAESLGIVLHRRRDRLYV